MPKTIKSITLIVLIFILGVFFISLNKNTDYDTEHLIGNKLNKIKFESLEHKKIFTEKDFKKNNYTLINFWASWCAPCRIEHPILIKLSKEQNLKILGVNFKDKKINALKFLKDLGNPYDYLAKDTSGRESVNYGIYGIPESILIDNKYIIQKKFVGPLNLEDYDDILEVINSL